MTLWCFSKSFSTKFIICAPSMAFATVKKVVSKLVCNYFLVCYNLLVNLNGNFCVLFPLVTQEWFTWFCTNPMLSSSVYLTFGPSELSQHFSSLQGPNFAISFLTPSFLEFSFGQTIAHNYFLLFLPSIFHSSVLYGASFCPTLIFIFGTRFSSTLSKMVSMGHIGP